MIRSNFLTCFEISAFILSRLLVVIEWWRHQWRHQKSWLCDWCPLLLSMLQLWLKMAEIRLFRVFSTQFYQSILLMVTSRFHGFLEMRRVRQKFLIFDRIEPNRQYLEDLKIWEWFHSQSGWPADWKIEIPKKRISLNESVYKTFFVLLNDKNEVMKTGSYRRALKIEV